MKMDQLLTQPKTSILALIFASTLVVALVLVVVVFPAYTSRFPEGARLIDIKNSWNKENMDKIVAIWNRDDSIDYAKTMVRVHILDLFFMPMYGMAVFSGLLLVARGLRSAEKIQRFFLWFSLSAWVAVGLDLIEEYHILVMLADTSNIKSFNAFAASLSAFICIWFICFGLLFMMLGGITCLILFLRHRGV